MGMSASISTLMTHERLHEIKTNRLFQANFIKFGFIHLLISLSFLIRRHFIANVPFGWNCRKFPPPYLLHGKLPGWRAALVRVPVDEMALSKQLLFHRTSDSIQVLWLSLPTSLGKCALYNFACLKLWTLEGASSFITVSCILIFLRCKGNSISPNFLAADAECKH